MEILGRGLDETTASTVNAYFGEFEDRVLDNGVTFSRFCHFLSHCKLLSAEFDHLQALKVYNQVKSEDPDTGLDLRGFSGALQIVAMTIHGDRERTQQGVHGVARQALEDLIKEINLSRDAAWQKETASELRQALYEPEVVRALYEYAEAIKILFQHFATCGGGSGKEPTGVNCRSMYRLCHVAKLVPDCVVPGELVDILFDLQPKHEMPFAKKRYFTDEKMLARGEEQHWSQPARNMLPGEPVYNFAEAVEIIGALAFCATPRVGEEPAEARRARIHSVLSGSAGLPSNASPELGHFSARNYVSETVHNENGEKLGKHQLDMVGIFAELSSELPALPEAQGPHLPQPEPGEVPTLPQPPTREELIEEAQRRREQQKNSKKGAVHRRKKTKAQNTRSKIDWDKAIWYAKRPPPPKPVIPPEWQRERRLDQLQALESRLTKESNKLAGLAWPMTGWVLRLMLIDEPLIAPPCPLSEEVSTLIETALTSRRLRNYDVAIAMLIRARKLWASLLSGRGVTAEWAGIEPKVTVPSPWGGSPPRRSGTMYQTIHPRDLATDCVERTDETQGLPQNGQEPLPSGDLAEATASGHVALAWSARGAVIMGRHSTIGPEERANQPSNSNMDLIASRQLGALDGMPERRYDPIQDFAQARGDGDLDLLRLPSEVGLFFMCELASLHSTIQEDDLAAQLLWQARVQSDSLPTSHPDAALVWSSLGRVAYRAANFDIAARSFSRARRIRERTVGGDSVEAATTYNNLACCLAALERPLEASAHLELAVEIMRELAGEDHPRTQSALRNMEKLRSAHKHLSMEVPHIYTLPMRDRSSAYLRKKKKKKGGKKSKSGDSDGKSTSGGSRKSVSSKKSRRSVKSSKR